MSLASLRLTLLTMIERILRRWLDRVSARLDAQASHASQHDAADSPDRPAPPDPRQPPQPPDHWVELVRQHAPQLLDAGTDANLPEVIDYRADETLIDLPEHVVPLRPPPPLHLLTPRHRPALQPAKVQPASKRPLRLEQVSAQSAEVVEPRIAQTAAQSPVAVGETRKESSADPSPIPADTHRLASTLPDEQGHSLTSQISPSANITKQTPSRSSQFSVAQPPIHTTLTDMPASADLPFVRTHPGHPATMSQRRTSVPGPSQVVFRPTMAHSPLNIGEITPDRWPSLPDLPPEQPHDSLAERQRREHLRREQEGRAWSG